MTPEAAQSAIRASVDQSVVLEALVVLYMFRELAEWVARSRALGSSHERHDGGSCCCICCAGVTKFALFTRLLFVSWGTSGIVFTTSTSRVASGMVLVVMVGLFVPEETAQQECKYERKAMQCPSFRVGVYK